MSIPQVEIKYTLGPRKIYQSGGIAVIALGKRFIPLVGRHAFVTIEVLKEEPELPKPKVEDTPG